MQNRIEIISNLLRDLEASTGTTEVAELLLHAMIESVKNFKLKNAKVFCLQFKEIVDLLENTEPRFGVLILNFRNLMRYFNDTICKGDCDNRSWKKVVINRISEILRELKDQKALVLKEAEKINVEGKTILIHDHSRTVQNVLQHYKRLGRNFKVVIAEQDHEKTQDNIERIHNAGIPFQVVPSYMFSHLHEQVDMMFFGALTLKDTMHFVMAPGALSIISEFSHDGVPVYMFINTEKFSLWQSKKRGEIFIHRHTRQHLSKPIEYERIKYSHDRVPVKFFKKIVTNEGIFGPDELGKNFKNKLRNSK